MFDAQQKQTKQSMQVKFSQFLEKFSRHLTLPESNFLHDISLGILKSKSVICLRIASELNEKTTLKKVCERFTRHLNKQDLGLELRNAIITEQCRGFDMETAIIVDDSDIVKPKAKCMEGLKKVRDGSTGRHDQLGYDLMNIIAYQDSDEGYEIKPICSELIAQDLEEDSLYQITEDRLIDIAIASNNKGVYLFDRGYDKRALFGHLQQNDMNYIVRSTGARSLIVNGHEMSFREVAKSIKLSHKYAIKDSGSYFKCGLKRVSIRLNPHPVKHPETIDTWLVVARYVTGRKSKDEIAKHLDLEKGYFYLFCDFPGQPELSVCSIINKAIRMYKMRWKIEEVHRHMKQAYGWEKIQLTSYTRLQNMNQIFLLTMCYLYSLKRFAYKYLLAFPSIMKYKNKTWEKIFSFVYYRLTELVSKCFSIVTRFNINPYKGKWHEGNQLLIPCLKNGGM